jgi:hypothetical protein
MDTERRQTPRRAIEVSVQVQARDRTFTGQLRSLSRLGALVQLPEALPVGTPLLLAITMPQSGEVLEARAQVVRVEYSGSVSAVAVMFGPMTPQAQAGIAALVEE